GYETEGMTYLQKAVDSEDKRMSDYDRGRLYFYLGDYANSRDYLEKAKGNGNATEELILLLGQCYENLNDRTYALTVYQSYLATSQSKAVYNQMGMCYASSGDYESALTAFQTGLGLSDVSYDQELRFNEIVTYEKLGNHIKAKELCASYVMDYPNDEAGQREYQFLRTR
ncbi:MAG: tetratricopeptide repeat protein, partial [Lachnospiraceae bacterium]|nr:tetratricopeptide repeat protein [Lachnospiraceae bacterium]